MKSSILFSDDKKKKGDSVLFAMMTHGPKSRPVFWLLFILPTHYLNTHIKRKRTAPHGNRRLQMKSSFLYAENELPILIKLHKTHFICFVASPV